MSHFLKITRSAVFFFTSLVAALTFYFLFQILFEFEELAVGKIASLEIAEVLFELPREHLFTLLLWLVAVITVLVWRTRLLGSQQKSEELLKRILETAADGIYLVDRQGRITFANAATERMLGLPRDQISRQTYNDTVWKITTVNGKPFPEEEQPFVRVMRAGQSVYDVEQSIERPDGKRVIVSINAAPLHNAHGEIIGEVGAMTDITERKHAEEALRESEDRYRELYEKAPIAYYSIKAADGRIRIANQRLAEMLGYSLDDLIGRPIFDLYADTSFGKEKARKVFARFRAGEEIRGEEMQMLTADGTPLWVSISARPVRDDEGKVVHSRSMALDITKRKQAEEALSKSEARNRTLVEAIPDSIFHMDRKGILLDYKPPKDRAPVLSFEKHVGEPVDQIMPPHLAQLVHRHLEQAVQTGTAQTFEYQIALNQTLYDREARIVPGSEEDALMIVRDITEWKKVDRLKNEFVSMVSHELRTPLTSIRGSLGLVASGTAGTISAQAKSLVDIAYKNSERLVRLINDILDIEKIESGKMVFDSKPIELIPLLEQVVEANRAYSDQFGVRLVLEQTLPGVKVNADPDRLTQVVTNLISNAAKFSPSGTAVDISVSRYDSSLRVSVTDHGNGIPEEFHSRIFQKFAQADSSNTRQRGGTGLGLSICKAIVERLGGQIGFETAPNVGTTFYFDLPEWRDKTEPLTLIPSRKPRVLICEDDRDAAMLLKLMLEQSGYAPEIAYDAAQAKELLGENDYAGMTLDLVLPDEDGISLIRELRDQDKTRGLPIVVVSMKAEKGRAELNGDAVQVIDWISKPIDPVRLGAAVKQAVSRAPVHPSRILHVDDDADILQVASVILQDVAQVDHATSLREARQFLHEKRYDLVILDLEMPDGSGLDLIPLLREQEPPVPAVIFSVEEVKKETAEKVSAALVKSRTSNEKLVQTIRSLIQAPIPA